MSVKVKPLLFTTTPSDQLVVVDVYAGSSTPSEPVNLVEKISGDTTKSLSKIFGGMNKDGGKLFKKAADLILSGKDFKSKDFAKTMIGEVFPSAKATLNDLKGNLITTMAASAGLDANTALTAYRAVKDGDYNNALNTLAKTDPLVKLYLDGHEIVKKAEDVDSLGDLFKVAGSVFGNSQIGEVLNMGEEFTILKGLVDSAVSLRVPELADYLIKQSDDRHKAGLKRNITHQAARYGDITTFYTYLYQMNIAEALAEEPELLINLIENYKHASDQGPTIEAMNMLVSILNQVNPNWNGAITGRPDVSIWRNVSKDLRELVYMDGRFVPLMVAGDQIREESLFDSAKRTMPWVALKPDTGINLV